MHQLLLGDEFDDALFERLCKAIDRLGGTIKDTGWSLGGSQEVHTFAIEVPGGALEAIAETYVGLSLRGSEELVALVASETLR